MQVMLHGVSYISANMGLAVPMFGTHPDKYGHCLISNVGTLGIDQAFAPLCSPMFAQLVACFGKIEKKAMVD